ncbi:MAG TPA: septation protein SpoVG family protein [Candidatus Methanoperedens sp.]|nr:septation protein SpoVG family protein [Candidatus Methanoperedens sp.]
MNITAVRIFPFETREAGGRTLAYAEIEIDGALLVRGLRVMETASGGLFVGFPAQRVRRERLIELVAPLTREARRAVREAVIAAYKRVAGWQPASRAPAGEVGGKP